LGSFISPLAKLGATTSVPTLGTNELKPHEDIAVLFYDPSVLAYTGDTFVVFEFVFIYLFFQFLNLCCPLIPAFFRGTQLHSLPGMMGKSLSCCKFNGNLNTYCRRLSNQT
jgi:hypothetical protein